MKKIISIFSSLSVIVAMSVIPAFAAPSVHTNFGQNLNANACNTSGAPIVNVSYKVTNDDDSGTLGNVWALDNYVKTVKVYAQADGSYCGIVKTQGQFTTVEGSSPEAVNTGGTVGAGVTGTFEGGYTATFNGTFSPTLKTQGNLGTYDYQCDLAYNCPGYFDWVASYFPGYTNFAQPYWAWNYHAGNNGSWVNAVSGNSGDITGN